MSRKRSREEDGDGEPLGEEAEAASQLLDDDEQEVKEIREALIGIIEKVRLVNFMNHTHFEVSFGPNINFIVGENGSGKSAVLVAIAICLGANPRFTSRAARLADLVQHGKESATIAVTLRNRGPEAYQPELFGEQITVERTIMSKDKETGAGGSSTWRLLDARGHVVSRTKKEVDAVLDVFGTQVDNPCCVLMQDTAKKFLRESKPEQLYKFFLEATQLQRMQDDYDKCQTYLEEARRVIAVKQRGVPELEKRIAKLKHEREEARQHLESRERMRELNAKLAWAEVSAKEAELEQDEERIRQLDRSLAKYLVHLEKNQAILDGFTESLAKGDHDAAAAAEKVKAAEARVEALQQRARQIEREQSVAKAEMQRRADAATSAKRKCETVEKEIKALRAKLQQDAAQRGDAAQKLLAEEMARKSAEVEQLEREIAECEHRVDELDAEVKEHANRTRDVEIQIQRLRNDENRVHRQLQPQQSARARLAAFGEDCPRLVELIETRAREFRVPPIGPLGDYVQLKAGKEKWTVAVEAALGPVANAFLFDNHTDEQTLRRLCQEARLKVPNLVVMRFQETRYNIPANALPQGELVYDVLDLGAHPMVHNCLVDQCSLERTLLVADLEEAKARVFRARDARIKEAIDITGQRYSLRGTGTEVILPARKESNVPRIRVSDEQRRRQLSEEKTRLSKEIDALEARRRDAAAAKNRAASELADAQHRLRDLRMRLRNARAELDARQTEVASARSDTHAAMIEELEAQLVTLREEQARAEAEVKKRAAERSAMAERAKPLQDEMRALELEVEQLQDQATKAELTQQRILQSHQNSQRAVAKLKAIVEKFTASRAETEAKIAQQRALIAEETEAAKKIAPVRPELGEDDTTENLKRRRDQLQRQIARGNEGRRPFEVIVNELKSTTQAFAQLEKGLAGLVNLIALLETSLTNRRRVWRVFRSVYSKRTQTSFSTYLSHRHFAGEITFEHANDDMPGKMTLSVNPNKKDWLVQQEMAATPVKGNARRTSTAGVDGQASTQALSGGERSYSTVALLLALWEVMEMPFCAMDEFDVFMDQVNRRMSVKMLIAACEARSECQYIFISPHTIAHIPSKPHVRIIRMQPPQRGQRTLQFNTENGAQ